MSRKQQTTKQSPRNPQSAIRLPPPSGGNPQFLLLSPQSAILVTLSILLLISLLSPAQAEDDKNPYTGNQEAIVEGQELYKMLNCYGCHGMQGGGGMGPSLSDEEWKIGDGSDASLMKQLMEGRANMPAFKDAIDKEQAWKIIAFVRTLYKGDPAKVQW